MAISPNFDVNIYLVFSPRQFSNLLNSGLLKKGDVIVYDEAGIGLDSRDWAVKINRKAMHVLESFRHLNLCVIFTVPTIAFVDKSVRRLYHYLFECIDIDYEKEVCIIKPLEVQLNPRFDKTYFKYPRARNSDGRIVKITRLKVHLIDEETKKKYEIRKAEFTQRVRTDFEKTITGAEIQQKVAQYFDVNQIAKEVESDLGAYTRMWGGKDRIDWHLIKAKYGCSEVIAKEVRSLILAKQKKREI